MVGDLLVGEGGGEASVDATSDRSRLAAVDAGVEPPSRRRASIGGVALVRADPRCRDALERAGVGPVASVSSVADLSRAAGTAGAEVVIVWPSIGRAPEHDVVEVKAVLPNVAVIVLSSEPRDVEFLGVLHTGAVGYLPADIPAERLVQVLAAVADGEVAIPRQLVGRLVEEVKGRGITIDFTDEQPPVELTDREWEVLCGLRQGQSTRQIADELYISAATVRSHVASIVRKVGARDRDDAIRLLDGR